MVDAAAALSNTSVVYDADGGDEEFHDSYGTVEIGTAVSIQVSHLTDPIGDKEGQAAWRRNHIYSILILMSIVIIGLSIQIGKMAKRSDAMKSDESVVTDNPKLQLYYFPSSSPSTNPSYAPSYAPSWTPSSIPSDIPSLSMIPSNAPSNVPSSSSIPSLNPSVVPSISMTPTSHPTNSPTTEFESYVPNVSTLRNQILCGYQGWFAYPGDGGINKWKHWFAHGKDPTVENLEVDLYPDMSEYSDSDLFESDMYHKDGTKVKFFSSARRQVVKKHFEWMRSYGISGVFHMRFMQDIDKPANYQWKTKVMRNVRYAAESTGRVFAVSYNIAGNKLDDSVLDDLKNDWMNLIDHEKITQSGRYIRHNGLPVLRIYGIGFKETNVTDTEKMADLINWFKFDAAPRYRVFLIGGVPSGWRNLTLDSREEIEWQSIYESLDGIHPWHVGRWGSIVGFETYYNNIISDDAAHCAELGILYMPTMWPGFSWHNMNRKNRGENDTVPLTPINSIPRLGGKFMWSQAYRYAQDRDISTIWMAQFDEVDEGTAIFKVAYTHELPAQGNWLTLNADEEGAVPRDWYLRLVGYAQQMMLGKIELSENMPIDASDYCVDCKTGNISGQ